MNPFAHGPTLLLTAHNIGMPSGPEETFTYHMYFAGSPLSITDDLGN